MFTGANVPSTAVTPVPQELTAGKPAQATVPAKTFWQNRFEQHQPGFVKLDFTISGSAMLGVYGRQSTAPTHVQFVESLPKTNTGKIKKTGVA